MAASDNPRPRWTSRLLAAACYLGLAVLLSLLPRGRNDVYLCHHRKQALIALLLLFLVILLLPIYLSFDLFLIRHHPVYTPHVATILLPGLALWGLISVLGVGMALAGSTRPLPLFAWLARRPRLMRVALIANGVLMALVVLVVGLAIHASSLAREEVVPAPVYFLYDNRDFDPLGAWVQKLFCYRICRVAQERWGPGSVVVAPITAENFRTAISHGRFVVLTGHGSLGAFATVDGWSVWPDKFTPPSEDGRVFPVIGLVKDNFLNTAATPGKDLQFVYLSACDGGKMATNWEQRFAPAEVVTFDRLSGAMEHLWWLWFGAPDRLKEIR